MVEVRQPIAEAAETDARADRTVDRERGGGRDRTVPARGAAARGRAARGSGGRSGRGARGGTRGVRGGSVARGHAVEPAAPAGARRALAGAGRSVPAAAESVPVVAPGEARAARTRADLLVERGRLLEDRLQRDSDALTSYEEALAADPDHVGALLALLLAGARRQDAVIVATALGGLARRRERARRAALAIEEARAWRQPLDGAAQADGAARALAVLTAELGREDRRCRSGRVLGELEALTGADAPPDVAARALAEIAGPRGGASIASWRSRCGASGRGSRRSRLDAPAESLASLEEAARLDPAHSVVAADRLQLVERWRAAPPPMRSRPS